MGTLKTPQTLLIVNADDFGDTEEVTRGIIEAHKNGIVTSTSLMANMPGFKHAITSIQENPTLDIGAHLNVHRGSPLTTCTYIGEDGHFLKNPLHLLFRYMLHPSKVQNEIFTEFDAQMQKIIQADVHISHVDTEKHLHIFPFVFKIALQIAEKYNIRRVRFPYERVTAATFSNPSQGIKTIVMNIFAPFNMRLLKKSRCTSPDRLYGVTLSKQFTVPNVRKLIAKLPNGISELSCHPGYEPTEKENYIDAHRTQELATLTDENLKTYIVERGIVLSTFSDIR